MSVATASESRRQLSLNVDGETDRLFRSLADARFDGNLSKTLCGLVAVHAGRELERARDEEEPFDVDPWRKQRLSRDLVSRIAGLVYVGNIRAHAYALAGVSGRQASQWLAQGRADVTAGKSSLYSDLVMGLDRAEAEMVSEQVAEARRKGDYKFVLGRFPEYAKRTVTDSNVTHAFTPLIEWDRLTVTEARTLVALLRKGSPDADDPSLTRRDRPASELIPAEIIEHEPLQLEAGETEAPLLELDDSPPEPAPALPGTGVELDERAPISNSRRAEIASNATRDLRQGEPTRDPRRSMPSS